MSQPQPRPHDHGLPPALYVISGASFAAALSARALDPVLPHIAEDFNVSIATAAGFVAVFAFTFSIIQPLIGAAADLFGKTRLMIGKRISAEIKPKWLRIGGYWYPRGGIPIDVFWQTGRLPKSLWVPDQGVAPYRGRG